MITEIGIVSGEILNLLEEKKMPLSITEITYHLDRSTDLINMSIGWLVRENYVHVVRKGQKYLALAPNEAAAIEVLENV